MHKNLNGSAEVFGVAFDNNRQLFYMEVMPMSVFRTHHIQCQYLEHTIGNAYEIEQVTLMKKVF